MDGYACSFVKINLTEVSNLTYLIFVLKDIDFRHENGYSKSIKTDDG